ncbi:hypothetical protein RSAG8_00008, partial [Rhizoctonia solani AG-8 WAC10335]
MKCPLMRGSGPITTKRQPAQSESWKLRANGYVHLDGRDIMPPCRQCNENYGIAILVIRRS